MRCPASTAAALSSESTTVWYSLAVAILQFLKRRTAFIRNFYERASQPFVETKQNIESSHPEFNAAPFDGSEQPPYLEEWQDSEDALDILGQMCLSFLAASLKLYITKTICKVRGALARIMREGVDLGETQGPPCGINVVYINV